MKRLLILFGLWIARLGGAVEPPYNKAHMQAARAGYLCWVDGKLSTDDMIRSMSKTASAVIKEDDSLELRFAVLRELYARQKVG